MEYVIFSMVFTVVIIACIGLYFYRLPEKKKPLIFKKKPKVFSPIDYDNSLPQNVYRVRKSILTNVEKEFYESFRSILPDRFIVLPQVNLAVVLEKVSGTAYQNELFRNIDFGIFDFNLKPLLLVEINDESHRRPDRVKRDKKVSDICSSAGLPLIRFWVSYGLNPDYFRRRFRQYLNF